MKKIYTLAIGLSIATTFTAQGNKSTVPVPGMTPTGARTFSLEDVAHQNEEKAMASHWYDYATYYADFNGTTPYGLLGNVLFPDSIIRVDYGGTLAGPWIHSVAQTFDVNAPTFRESSSFGVVDGSYSYTVDSVSIVGFYSRQDMTVTDTLVVNFVPTSASNLNSVGYFTTLTSLSDTVFMLSLDWDFPTTTVVAPTITKKILLNDAVYADSTSNGLHVIDEVIGATMAANSGMFAITVDFIPGYAYTGADIVDNKNYWWFGSYELNGENTYPIYDKEDYNVASILPQDVRYDDAGGWNGTYIPSFGYMGGATGNEYSYEAMAISALLSQDDAVLGVKENVELGITLGQNMPNPFNNNSTINFELNNASDVQFEFVDMTGKNVKTIDLGTLAAGSHSVEVSANDFAAGVYFYSLVSGENRVTSKMIVKK